MDMGTAITGSVNLPSAPAVAIIHGLRIFESASSSSDLEEGPHTTIATPSSLAAVIPQYDVGFEFAAAGTVRQGALRLAYAILATAHAIGPPPATSTTPAPAGG